MSQLTKAIALLTVLFMAFGAFAVAADDSDATAIGSLEADDFKENHNGTLKVSVANTEGAPIAVTLTVFDGDKEVKSVTETVSETTQVVKISLKLGAGTHDITVKATAVLDGTTDPVTVSPATSSIEIKVDSSIWSGWVPYVVLVILAIIIILVIFIWNRGRPKKKPTVTFTDLEEGKAIPEEAAPATDTGRKKYEANKKTDEPKPSEGGRIKYKSDRRK
jgi:hypothetical protein